MKIIGKSIILSLIAIFTSINTQNVQATATGDPEQAILMVKTNVENIRVVFYEGNTILLDRMWDGNVAMWNKAYIGQEITFVVQKEGYNAVVRTITITDTYMEEEAVLTIRE